MKWLLPLLLICGVADAETVKQFTSPIKVETAAGNILELPPGYYVPEDKWSNLDFELKRLQEAETRLRAENAELRLAVEVPSLNRVLVLGIFVAGVGLGAGAVLLVK